MHPYFGDFKHTLQGLLEEEGEQLFGSTVLEFIEFIFTKHYWK